MMVYIKTLLFIVIAHLTGCFSEKQTLCTHLVQKITKMASELTRNHVPVDYICPREFDPISYTECCENGSCCEANVSPLPLNDEWIMVIAIVVISSCLILTTIIVICCFWSKCPLYNTCRPSYNTTNVIVYSLGKDDPTPLMPAEGNKNSHYNPCTVKIKKMQEV